MYENAAFCKVDVNLIKIDYSDDPKSCLINKFCISLRHIAVASSFLQCYKWHDIDVIFATF